MLSRDIVDSLFPSDLAEPRHWEHRYPPRDLPEGAQVTRFSPSPTGYLHIGGVYAATIDVDIARHSGGVYFVRLEDTDQARVNEGAEAQFAEAFAYFSIGPDEDDRTGHYGPYRQSARAEIYLTYVRELLRQGRAYLCFATKQDLEEITARQRAAGALPGYYGKWAIWRDADPEQVMARLAAGDPYVVRFRSPGTAGGRVTFTDAIRGELTLDDNRNDAVILKSSDTEPRLPTYHFAHAVDDHLMRVTLVIRGEEWISSVPLHLQLFDALGFPRVQYAHIALLMKQDGASRRKLSKRKDPEATVSFYIEQGYPAPAVQYYLRGLANGRLAEMPLAEALAASIRLSECGTAGPLVDMVKLDDICADYIATLPGSRSSPRSSPGRSATRLTWPPCWPPSGSWRSAPWPSSGKVSPTRARTYASGRISGPSTDTSSRSCSSRSPTRLILASAAWTRRSSAPSPSSSRTATSRRREPSGSTRSAGSRPTSGSRRARRSTSRIPPPTGALSAKPPRSSGSCSPVRRAAPTWPPWPPRSAPMRSCGASARSCDRARLRGSCVWFLGLGLFAAGWPGAQRRQLVQAVYVELLGIGKHDVLLFLGLLGRLLSQL